MAPKENTSRRGSTRILELIEWIALQREPVSLTDIACGLDWPKSTSLLLLRLLVEKGYALRDADQRYILVRLPGEPSIDNPAWGVLSHIARPMLEMAVSATLETGCIGVLTADSHVRYCLKVLPEREIRYDRDISGVRVAHHTASGLVLLAGLPAGQLDAYLTGLAAEERAHEDTIRQCARQVAEEGYATNLQGRIEGAAGVAAPIVDSHGDCIAALNIAGPRERIRQNLASVVAAARVAAQQVSEELTRRQPVCFTRRRDL